MTQNLDLTDLHAHEEAALLLGEADRLEEGHAADAGGHAVLEGVVVQVDGAELLLLRMVRNERRKIKKMQQF